MFDPVTIRLSREADVAALARLAERDSRPLPGGTLLIAERAGVIDAALSLETGEAVADPFKRTAELVDVLRAHARLRRTEPHRRARHGAFKPRLVGGTV